MTATEASIHLATLQARIRALLAEARDLVDQHRNDPHMAAGLRWALRLDDALTGRTAEASRQERLLSTERRREGLNAPLRQAQQGTSSAEGLQTGQSASEAARGAQRPSATGLVAPVREG